MESTRGSALDRSTSGRPRAFEPGISMNVDLVESTWLFLLCFRFPASTQGSGPSCTYIFLSPRSPSFQKYHHSYTFPPTLAFLGEALAPRFDVRDHRLPCLTATGTRLTFPCPPRHQTNKLLASDRAHSNYFQAAKESSITSNNHTNLAFIVHCRLRLSAAQSVASNARVAALCPDLHICHGRLTSASGA